MPGGLSACAFLYTAPNQKGQPHAIGSALTGRYDFLPYKEMLAYGLWKNISSVRVYSPAKGAANLLLYPTTYDADFFDPDLHNPIQFVSYVSQGSQFDANLKGFQVSSGYTWENHVAHAILVHTQRGPEIRVNLRDVVEPIWQQALGKLPTGLTLTAKGGLGFHWVPFPKHPGLSPYKTYAAMTAKFIYDVPLWPADYWIIITWYLEFYLTNNSTLGGYVARWEFGTDSGAAEDAAKAVAQCFGEIAALRMNQVLQQGLGQKAKDIYLLPGNQTGVNFLGTSGVFQENLENDVTVVSELN